MTNTTNAGHHIPRTLGDQTWQNHAACGAVPRHLLDPEIFFAEPEETDRIRAAKALCAQCPVRRHCLDAALENGDRAGIRGGMTEQERAPLHSRIAKRLDYSRVNAALEGRDIHLTKHERRAVARAAYLAGTPADGLARILKITEEHAQKRYREVREALGKRTANEAITKAADGPGRDDLGTAA
ncbi:hypothetical protein GCM10027160_17200 [Streptomyces calidiresistens]|uniref:Transcriptional regulator WhiB n=1 Tax=Streptomyces calidiresistens TaxID=1485586 RepID=A0A7W3SZM4_9ACTN|nr:WhiB family transcriptional regulator [Streptomyces calidiresistens]MBB0228213.1 WhiB family transcriptional regulator [Streptomyces calidiresistens]